ncbi:MAG: MarR family transcriptional regulator [Desulfarculaceae bacterium]|nr:MarR family transcriptional regulator [Desulfarculaceae bacterium]MCF8047173.1 MarR family transcriptional regulator [Desulfarculaceae bacterium]MCF8064322.1 MarR family transcriptional regulator [Desulfarculaceae bacterium]MCF8096752.1 MarR family transcriptional regulator [Desulfarculaceae bacterium]MCF8121455.1 MarR family transcriptional regulator [Desulfarculaceae bacterium]
MSGRRYRSSLSVDEKVLMSMVRVSELFKKTSSEIFKNYGLTFTQYNVLRVLNSSENGTNTITKVSNILLVTGANMTGVAKRMERDGFLLRKRYTQDERVTLLEITPKGKKTLENILPEKEKHIDQFVGVLSEEDKTRLLALLKQIYSKNETK